MKFNPGEIVKVFYDPLTRESLEEEGTLIKVIDSNYGVYDGYEVVLCMVLFPKDNGLYERIIYTKPFNEGDIKNEDWWN